MTTWLYAASKALASESDTLGLAYESGFIWRSFYNTSGNAIACVKDIQPGDELVLGYRHQGKVKLLARFRVGCPDQPISASPAFGTIPTAWVATFEKHGYAADPTLKALVGIFVEEVEPLSGQLDYNRQNSLSRLPSDPLSGAPSPKSVSTRSFSARTNVPPPKTNPDEQVAVHFQQPPTASVTARDGVHIGIDVGGRPEKGFDLCITHWANGLLANVCWTRVPHSTPLPTTESLRALVHDGNLAALAATTQASATATAAGLWCELERHSATGTYVDSPSAFSRNSLGHGRLCEKQSLTGVSFQSTPSLACGKEHGGDWGWLVYGMVAFAACLHRGQLGPEEWAAALQKGTFARFDSPGIVLRECFPTATVSVLRTRKREADVKRALSQKAAMPEVQAVLQYLEHGVKGVKRPRDPLYDRADALVAALGALPHVAQGFREVPNWPTGSSRWDSGSGDDKFVEGTFICVA